MYNPNQSAIHRFFTSELRDNLCSNIQKEITGNNNNDNWSIASSQCANTFSITFRERSYFGTFFMNVTSGPSTEMINLEFQQNVDNTISLEKLTLASSIQDKQEDIERLINRTLTTFNQSLPNHGSTASKQPQFPM
jgi:hypothetical protein